MGCSERQEKHKQRCGGGLNRLCEERKVRTEDVEGVSEGRTTTRTGANRGWTAGLEGPGHGVSSTPRTRLFLEADEMRHLNTIAKPSSAKTLEDTDSCCLSICDVGSRFDRQSTTANGGRGKGLGDAWTGLYAVLPGVDIYQSRRSEPDCSLTPGLQRLGYRLLPIPSFVDMDADLPKNANPCIPPCKARLECVTTQTPEPAEKNCGISHEQYLHQDAETPCYT